MVVTLASSDVQLCSSISSEDGGGPLGSFLFTFLFLLEENNPTLKRVYTFTLDSDYNSLRYENIHLQVPTYLALLGHSNFLLWWGIITRMVKKMNLMNIRI